MKCVCAISPIFCTINSIKYEREKSVYAYNRKIVFFFIFQCHFKKSIMVHQTSSNPALNSSIIIQKKLPTTNNQISPRLFKKPQQSPTLLGQDTTTIKLPTLIKRTQASSKIYH